MSRTQNRMHNLSEGVERSSSVQSVQAFLRFLRVVRSRKEIVFLTLTVAGLLAALYYATATRIYESRASLLVLQTGDQTFTIEVAGERVAKDLMATYKNLFKSDVVLENALSHLMSEHRIDFGDAPRSAWVDILRHNLSVAAMRGTNILEIGYRSRDPETAPAVVDSVLTAYLEFMGNLHKSTSREILDIFNKEKTRLEQELYAKQLEKLRVRGSVGELAITEGQQGTNVAVKRAISLNESWIRAHEKKLEAQSLLQTLETAITNGEDLQQHTLAMVDPVGREVLLQKLGLSSTDAYMLSHMTQQLLNDKADLRSAQQVYGPANRKVQEIQERILVMEQYLQNRRQIQEAELRRLSDEQLAPMLLDIAEQKLKQALEHEKAIYASYEEQLHHSLQLDHSMTQLEMLDHDLDRIRASYDVALDRIKDIDLGQDTGMLRTEVLSHPEIPLGPVSPRLAMVALAALALGLVAGMGIIYVLDLLDDRFRSPEEIAMQLGVPVLAMIRKLEPLESGGGVDDIHVNIRPNGAGSESFRTLRTALAFTDGGAQRLVISSTEPGDGKTTIAVNLAVVFAQSGKRTLLIDGDMRRPGLTPLLNLRGERGLSMILRDSAPVAESIRANLEPSVLENFDVIPSGPRPGNPIELLAGDRFAEFLAWAETTYDQIVIDSPPALAVSDAAIIGRLVDGVVLTIRPEKNRRRIVVRATETFPALGVKVLGMVVNHAASEKNQNYYDYDYGYAYSYSYEHDDGSSDDYPEPEHSLQRPKKIPRRVA